MQIRQGLGFELGQVVSQFAIVKAVFLVQQFIKDNRQCNPLTFDIGNVGDRFKQILNIGFRDGQKTGRDFKSGFFEVDHQAVNAVDKRPADFDFIVYDRRYKWLQPGFVTGFPEPQGRLHKGDNSVAALHVTLLAQKMNELVPPVGDLINLGGYLPQPAFGPDIIEKGRKKPGELFGQVIHRRDAAV